MALTDRTVSCRVAELLPAGSVDVEWTSGHREVKKCESSFWILNSFRVGTCYNCFISLDFLLYYLLTVCESVLCLRSGTIVNIELKLLSLLWSKLAEVSERLPLWWKVAFWTWKLSLWISCAFMDSLSGTSSCQWTLKREVFFMKKLRSRKGPWNGKLIDYLSWLILIAKLMQNTVHFTISLFIRLH